MDGCRFASLPACGVGFLALPLKKVAPRVLDDLCRWLGAETGAKPATKLHLHAMLRAALTQAVRCGWVESHPVALASAPWVHRPQVHPPAVGDGDDEGNARRAAGSRAPLCPMLAAGAGRGPRQRDDPACRRPRPAVGARGLWLQRETTAWSRQRPPSWFGDRSLRSHVSKTSRTPRPTRQADSGLDEATPAASSPPGRLRLARRRGGRALLADDYVLAHEAGSQLPVSPDRGPRG